MCSLHSRSMRLILSVIGLLLVFISFCSNIRHEYSTRSPDKNLAVTFCLKSDSTVCYSVSFRDTVILSESQLGIIREDGDFSKGLSLVSLSGPEKVSFSYDMLQGKKSHCVYEGFERIFHLQNPHGQKMDIVFRVSDDGASFRYVFPDSSADIKKIIREISQFSFLKGTRAFIQPLAAARSGWNQTNPSYEEYYTPGTPADSLSFNDPGWVFPALFQSGEFWFLLSETAPDRNYCGCRLQQDTLDHTFHIRFPQSPEFIFNGPVNPESRLPWKTPWRLMVVGRGLKAVVESTLETDLSEPPKLNDLSMVKPGRASWSWVLLKDNFTVYNVQKQFVDYAAEMGWEYCLVDAFWDVQIGEEKIRELSRYAQSKKVGLILWYNSAGDWNTTPLRPRDRLLTHKLRMAEFQKLKDMGIRGVKVDFFGGDGQSVMAYYQDIIEDAAQSGMMVNCHGATYPRGWHRTHPNLITVEAVRGFEYLTFDQTNTDREASHSTYMPFTRNVFDPMDFTPVCFSEIPGLKRMTTQGFQTAASVIFVSGIQHFAEIPEGMSHVPAEIQDFMRHVPVTWDETRFIEGYPGRLAVLARRSGDTWFIAGINGEDKEKNLSIELDFISSGIKGLFISDGKDNRSFRIEQIEMIPGHPFELKLQGNGGFVIRFQSASIKISKE